MNTDNVRTLIAWLKAPPEGQIFDMRSFVLTRALAQAADQRYNRPQFSGRLPEGFCGTAVCLAGAAALMVDPEQVYALVAAATENYSILEVAAITSTVSDIAAEWLDIDQIAADLLFDPEDSLESFCHEYNLVDGEDEGFGPTNSSITAAKAITVLEELLAINPRAGEQTRLAIACAWLKVCGR